MSRWVWWVWWWWQRRRGAKKARFRLSDARIFSRAYLLALVSLGARFYIPMLYYQKCFQCLGGSGGAGDCGRGGEALKMRDFVYMTRVFLRAGTTFWL